ncbi:MAG: hypothetical protein MJE66_09385, partial [Proteobacteria bacterium]|nr:hypothetical protein [Pseudomonadota bacterium]
MEEGLYVAESLQEAQEPDRPVDRTAADVSSLLVELSRVLKAIAFYPSGDAAHAAALARGFLAWQTHLSRCGPLTLRMGEEGLQADGVEGLLARGYLTDLAARFVRQGLFRLDLSPELDAASFESLVRVLDLPAAELDRRGGLARTLSDGPSRGVAVNGVGAPAPDRDPLGESLLTSRTRRREESEPEAPESAFEDEAKPELEDEPLQLPGPDDPVEALRHQLLELNECDDDFAYRELLTEIVAAAEAATQAEEAYRVLLLLATHAVGTSGRSGFQSRLAQESLADLAKGELLAFVLDRAASPGDQVGEAANLASIRSTQVLLQLGDRAVEPVLQRALAEERPERRGQLIGILVALGDRSRTAIERVLMAVAKGR